MKIVVIGGSGLIGSKLVEILRHDGHDVLAASRATGVNTLTGEGLADALAGAAVVDDVANAPSWEDRAVMEFFAGTTIDIAGPEPIRMDDLVRRFLIANRDPRQVITDPAAGYFGTRVNDESLTPGPNPRLGPTRFGEWLTRAVPQR